MHCLMSSFHSANPVESHAYFQFLLRNCSFWYALRLSASSESRVWKACLPWLCNSFFSHLCISGCLPIIIWEMGRGVTEFGCCITTAFWSPRKPLAGKRLVVSLLVMCLVTATLALFSTPALGFPYICLSACSLASHEQTLRTEVAISPPSPLDSWLTLHEHGPCVSAFITLCTNFTCCLCHVVACA